MDHEPGIEARTTSCDMLVLVFQQVISVSCCAGCGLGKCLVTKEDINTAPYVKQNGADYRE